MCGIVGMAGKLTFDHKGAFKDMLQVSTLRGVDATGVLRVVANGSMSYLKLSQPSLEYFNLKGADAAMNPVGAKVLLGHTRSATIGGNKSHNAHPFIIDDDKEEQMLGGVHNGTLRGNWRTALVDSNKFDVDSQGLYHNIAAFGVENVLPLVEGAWALVWQDARDNTLNFIRNSERPLYLAYSLDKSVILWASEKWMLLVAERQGKIKLFRAEDGEFAHSLAPDYLYSFTIDMTKTKDEVFNLQTPLKKIEGKKAGVTTHNRWGWSSNDWDASSGGYKDPDDDKGGSSVTNPFLPPFAIDIEKLGDLNDRLPPSLTEVEKSSQEGSGTSASTDKSTKTPSDKDTPTATLKNNARAKLSLVSTTSSSSPPPSKNGSLGTFGKGYGFSTGVREVAGIKYANFTSIDEISEEDFHTCYGHYCSFCGEDTIIEEVNTILPYEQGFICNSCCIPDKKQLVLN